MDGRHIILAAVYYKPTIIRELQIWKHTRIQSDATEQLAKGQKNGTAISAQYEAYKQPFTDLLLQFKLLLAGHHDCIKMAKHRIKLLKLDTVQYTLYLPSYSKNVRI